MLFRSSLQSPAGNLVHEQDYIATVILAAAALCLWRGRRLATAMVLAGIIPYLAIQWQGRERAREAAAKMEGRHAAVFPGRALDCRWVVLSEGAADLSAHCSAGGILREARRFAKAEDRFTRASESDPVVRSFREKDPIDFAEVRAGADGGAMVVWRDLRVAYQEPPGAEPSGIHVSVDPAGRVLSARHRWWLRLW